MFSLKLYSEYISSLSTTLAIFSLYVILSNHQLDLFSNVFSHFCDSFLSVHVKFNIVCKMRYIY